jgi:hypothetical protein
MITSQPLAYIAVMDERRNVSKGQRAMVKAMRYPDVEHGDQQCMVRVKFIGYIPIPSIAFEKLVQVLLVG